MHGNVWEWCEEPWHDNYQGAPLDGSHWGSGDNNNDIRLLRGGSWSSNPIYCRSAARSWWTEAVRDLYVGFRVVCTQDL
jgi:formylglycine-generating enzyme required for sulfatase activity